MSGEIWLFRRYCTRVGKGVLKGFLEGVVPDLARSAHLVYTDVATGLCLAG